MTYQAKLRHNYHELTLLERIRYWLRTRRHLSLEERFFFEGCRNIPGQMYVADRRALYHTVLQRKPTHCYEIGTWIGGGSTFFLTSAFAALGKGKLVTIEADERAYRQATRNYQRHLPQLLPFVEFQHGDDISAILPLVQNRDACVECFLLDGAEDSADTLHQYRFFEPLLRSGSIMMAHDWNTEKMMAVRPLVENDPRWSTRMRIHEPESVGLVVCEYDLGIKVK